MTIIKLQGAEEKQKGVYYEYDADHTPLGEGAMGRVYKGYCVDTRTNNRVPVAIKAIFENIPDRVIERARREASVRIDSPYLLKMLGFIEQPFTSVVNGQKIMMTRYFVVMELLTGVTLYDLVQGVYCDQYGNTMQSVKQLHDAYIKDKYTTIQQIMVKVLRGVMALHNANYIHRDIDPSNIMITSNGNIKLIDFGICKAINSLNTLDQNLTSTGVFMGKVNYAAPELVIGDVAHQGPATDIYALGILLFQLCAGHLPFSGDDNDVLLAHMRKKLPLHEIEKRSLKKIIAKATEKSQSMRYDKAEKMLADLETIDFTKGGLSKSFVVTGICVCMIIVCLIGYALWSNTNTSDEETTSDETEEIIDEPIVDELAERFNSIQRKLFSSNNDDVMEAFQDIAQMANDERYKDAMFEYGLTFSAGNSVFDIPTQRQKVLNINEDLDRANLWLRRTLEKDHESYRAVYWLLNNMITKKKRDTSSVLSDEISDLIQHFNELTEGKDDPVVQKYREAINLESKTLLKWNISLK